MSVANYIRCQDCKEYLWVGQRDHIYHGEEYIDTLQAFLFKHIGHMLKFDRETWRDHEGFWSNGRGGWVDFEENEES